MEGTDGLLKSAKSPGFTRGSLANRFDMRIATAKAHLV
jgi:hypothetical protein